MEVRKGYREELDQLRLQVELMGVMVDRNLERMRSVIVDGDASVADAAYAQDDEIDRLNVSLTERCYDLLAREAPVADELRFDESVLRVLAEFERIGDLALRVVNLHATRDDLVRVTPLFDVICSMTDVAIESYRTALRAWAAQDLSLATDIATRVHTMDAHYEHMMSSILRLDGPNAVRTATDVLVGGRALERIADHAAIIGARLRYLITGDPDHLSAEVR